MRGLCFVNAQDGIEWIKLRKFTFLDFLHYQHQFSNRKEPLLGHSLPPSVQSMTKDSSHLRFWLSEHFPFFLFLFLVIINSVATIERDWNLLFAASPFLFFHCTPLSAFILFHRSSFGLFVCSFIKLKLLFFNRFPAFSFHFRKTKIDGTWIR